MEDTHMAVWELESTAPTAWDLWIEALEARVGHDLDGTWRIDGYCLDKCFAWFREGLTIRAAAARIEHDKRFAPLDGGIDD